MLKIKKYGKYSLSALKFLLGGTLNKFLGSLVFISASLFVVSLYSDYSGNSISFDFFSKLSPTSEFSALLTILSIFALLFFVYFKKLETPQNINKLTKIAREMKYNDINDPLKIIQEMESDTNEVLLLSRIDFIKLDIFSETLRILVTICLWISLTGIISTLRTSTIFLSIFLSFILSQLTSLIVALVTLLWLVFKLQIPESKDRMTVIIAIFGTIISLIALFK